MVYKMHACHTACEWMLRELCLCLCLALCVPRAWGVVDSVRFLRPADFDVLLTDITESDLYLMAGMEGSGYLNVSRSEPAFPAGGLIMGAHRRLMINLLVRRRLTWEYRNVVFMVDTGSPYTFLSAAAMSAMVGPGENVPSMLRLEIHGRESMVCYLSPQHKHFADINLLGMDYLEMKRAQLEVDWTEKLFLMWSGQRRE